MHISPVLLLSAFASLSAVSLGAGPWAYPEAPKSDHVDDYHGTKVADPYNGLEELDSPQTRAWVEAENKLTFSYLDKLPERSAIKTRLTQLWNYPKFGLPQNEAGKYFFSKNDGLQNQPVLYVQDSATAEPRVLIDPNTLSKDGTVAITETAPSYDARYVAYATASAGSDWNEVRVRDVATGRDTDDLVKWLKFSGVSWTRDNQGFFYSRYPAEKVDAGTGKTFSKLEDRKVYYHRLGTSQDSDAMIAEIPEQPTWMLYGYATEDGRYLLITTRRGDSNNNLLKVVDLKEPTAPEIANPKIPIVETWDAEFNVVGNDGSTLYVLTNLDAPKRRIISIDIQHPNRANWKTVVAESADTLDDAGLVGGKLVVSTMHDVAGKLTLYELDGSSPTAIEMPGIGTVGGFTGRQDSSELFYSFTGFTQPTEIFRRDVTGSESTVFRAPQIAFDPAPYVTEQVFYPSKDGTKVPMFIVHKRDIALDGTHPTLLYAYGGFNISMTPAFSPIIITWLEMGGIYAVPNIRGGGEYGKAWHEAGTKERKQNVFDDFIAAADWLCEHKYTSHEKLAISGASNGGLLIGAVLNQRPDLCRVAFPGVGVMDMLKFQKFTIGYAWVSDYGSSDTAEGFKYLVKYSPLHTIRQGGHYPAVLVTTADHDDRVFPAHSFKYTATLQAAVKDVPDSGPILIRIETNAGHGAGKPTSKQIDETSDKYAFAAHLLGMRP